MGIESYSSNSYTFLMLNKNQPFHELDTILTLFKMGNIRNVQLASQSGSKWIKTDASQLHHKLKDHQGVIEHINSETSLKSFRNQ